MSNYKTFELNDINKELLDSIKTGDFVKCNDWARGLLVVGTSENYFIMTKKAFGETIYSVCEKKPAGYARNNFSEGFYRIGRHNYIFGAPNGCSLDTEQGINNYLAGFESGEIELSERAAVSLRRISIKRR